MQLQPGVHRPHPRIGEVAAAVAAVLGLQALGHQELDRLAEQLLALVAEQPLGLAVDQTDAPLGVDDHHGVGGRLHQPAELLLGGPQRFLDSVPLGDVADDPREPRALTGLPHPERQLDRELAAVPAQPDQLDRAAGQLGTAGPAGPLQARQVQRVEPLGHEHPQRPAHDLLGAPAEHGLGAPVPRAHPPVGVGRQIASVAASVTSRKRRSACSSPSWTARRRRSSRSTSPTVSTTTTVRAASN